MSNSDIDSINKEISIIEQKIEFAKRGGRNSSQYISSLNKLKAEKEDIIWHQKRMEQNKQFELEKARLEQQIAEYQEKLERLQAEFDKAKEQRKELDTTYKFLKEHPELNDLKIKDFVDRYEKID